jgi:hypothetical protein
MQSKKIRVLRTNFSIRIDVDATLENINNISSVKILVRFPDESTKLFNIEATRFIPVRPFMYQIKEVPIILHINKSDWSHGMLIINCIYLLSSYCLLFNRRWYLDITCKWN